MKPDAILSAAVELITQIEATNQPANEVINTYTRTRRYIGSKDRRALTDWVWNYIRHRARLSYLYPSADSKTKLLALQDGIPEIIPDAPFYVNMEVPSWLPPLIPNAEQELPALLQPAQTILRTNGDREQIRRQLAAEGIETEPTSLSPFGLRLKKRANIQGSQSYRTGRVEIQDEGSQCVALETDIHPGDTVLDYCAGAGGKSLIFAQMMNNQGLIVAHDISDRSLSELTRRATRAQATCIQVQKPLQPTLYDHVVVDAPCSGTGTWRRCPDRRWKLTREELNALTKTQADILDKAVHFVRPGGYLSYMTCSLTTTENTDQAFHFQEHHPSFRLIRQRLFSPATTGTDGLFIAVFQQTRTHS